MGGFNSGGWNDTGRRVVEDVPSLPIGALADRGMVRPGYRGGWEWRDEWIRVHADAGRVTLVYDYRSTWTDWMHVEEAIAVDSVACRFGGTRPYWRCPICQKRVLALYGIGWFRCRGCHRLAYRSQRDRTTFRALERGDRLRRNLGMETFLGWGSVPPRPKGMHLRTFARAILAIKAADDVAEPFMRHMAGDCGGGR